MMATPENILLIRLKSIGDVALTLPAISALRDNFPKAKITFLTSRKIAPLLRGFCEVDRVLTLDRPGLRNPFRAVLEMFRLMRRLRSGDFSLAVDFQGYGETAWLSWWSGAPERWGSVYGPGREWLYTQGVRRNNKIHIADWNLSLLRQCGLKTGEIKNEFVPPGDALEAARDFFSDNDLDPGRPTLVLQPLTSTPGKNWPLENYLTLARHFQLRGLQVIFSGGPEDAGALEPARRLNFAIATGNPLLTSAALAKLSTLIVGGDTGLLHLAVAGGKHVVMLKSHLGNSYPFQHADWAVTPGPGKKVSDIPVAAVIAACEVKLRR